MAWTSPMTFTSGSVLTAAQLNTHLRDNMMELAPAKTTQAGSICVGNGYNKIAERIPKGARVDTAQNLNVTEYRDLSTVGPKVTVTTGTQAIVFVAAGANNAGASNACYMSYQITGATSKDPSDDSALIMEGVHASKINRWSQMIVEDDLTPGVNTFTCKYKSGTTDTVAQWYRRFILVWPF